MPSKDDREAENIKQEETISKAIKHHCDELLETAKDLVKEYKSLSKQSKKLQKTLSKKEKENTDEMRRAQELKETMKHQSTGQVQKTAQRLRDEETNESKLSQKEAEIVQRMVGLLHQTKEAAERALQKDANLRTSMIELYTKDLDDYNLETAESQPPHTGGN